MMRNLLIWTTEEDNNSFNKIVQKKDWKVELFQKTPKFNKAALIFSEYKKAVLKGVLSQKFSLEWIFR